MLFYPVYIMADLVDVVMPVYNAATYLQFSIESILQQTFTDFRFIIVDDWSTDGSRDILQRYAKQDQRITLIRNETNSGICMSLNKWVVTGNAKYIVRMDADDISHIDRINKQVAFMEQHIDVWVCGCNVSCINKNGIYIGEKKYPLNDQDIRKKIFFFSPISHPGSIIRREVFAKTWWYDNTYVLAEDLDLWFRIWKYSDFSNLPEVLLDYRIYDNNSTHSKFQKMTTQAIRVRYKAIRQYGYKAWCLWIFAMWASLVMQFFPARFTNWLFYKLRSLIS